MHSNWLKLLRTRKRLVLHRHIRPDLIKRMLHISKILFFKGFFGLEGKLWVSKKLTVKQHFPVKPRYCRSVLIHCRASWICSNFLSKPRQIFQKLFVAALAKIIAALTKIYYISIQFLKKVRQISEFYRESTLLGIGFSFRHARKKS